MENLNGIIKFKEKKTFKNKRNYGIDFLKILSMVNIIILHINGASCAEKGY